MYKGRAHIGKIFLYIGDWVLWNYSSAFRVNYFASLLRQEDSKEHDYLIPNVFQLIPSTENKVSYLVSSL